MGSCSRPLLVHLNKKLFCLALGFFFLACHRDLPLCCGQLSSTVSDCGLADSGLDDRPPIYIVFVRKPEHMLFASPAELELWHRSFLPTANLSSGEPRMVYSYDEAISGFAARLTPAEVRAMEAKEDFLYAQQDERLVPQTTYTPDFLRLRTEVWDTVNRGEGVIIGVVDTGINPSHASFNGTGFPPPPLQRWKGFCEFNNQSVCNNKLLGAKNFDVQSMQQSPLPFDFSGHGTHVASTAAGNAVVGATIRGLASGTASGAAPGAYLAIYKAIQMSEMLAAINQAIKDGVDILSISMLSLRPQLSLLNDLLAIGGLSAVRNGILVSLCAANYGPMRRTLRNDAPWLMTVGASSTDRALRVLLTLGDGTQIAAESLFGGLHLISWSLVFPGANGDPAYETCSRLPAGLAGSFVMCFTSSFGSSRMQAEAVFNAGGASMILMNSRERGNSISEIPETSGLPNFHVFAITNADSVRLVGYTALAAAPEVSVRPIGTEFGVEPIPAVAHFSSRGPSAVNGGIIKPDILGPGVNILAAAPVGTNDFYLSSGTSMATPHLSGIAAIVKSSHWGWSPAMIRSAIMTTSGTLDSRGGRITDETGYPAKLFATGAGYVYPPRVNDPGLVYDAGINDYIQYLCGLGYSDDQVTVINGGNRVVCAQVRPISAEQLNYPSISVTLRGPNPTVLIQRVVTHVGPPSLVDYTAQVDLPPVVRAVVQPSTLSFSSVGERQGFTVTFTRANPTPSFLGTDSIFEGLLRWVPSNNKHVVASPLLVAVV